jgi:hypothetical protein
LANPVDRTDAGRDHAAKTVYDLYRWSHPDAAAWPAPPRVPEAERRRHRCCERCVCPADGKPMHYAPSTGQHACQDPDCEYAHPKGD